MFLTVVVNTVECNDKLVEDIYAFSYRINMFMFVIVNILLEIPSTKNSF